MDATELARVRVNLARRAERRAFGGVFPANIAGLTGVSPLFRGARAISGALGADRDTDVVLPRVDFAFRALWPLIRG